MTISLTIPSNLLPENTKFGCGPSVIRHDNVAKLIESDKLGTSHRQAPVRNLVGRCQSLTRDLMGFDSDYQVVLGNGGATAFWAVASASLIKQRSAHAVFGSFGAKFVTTVKSAPFLEDPKVVAGGVTLRKQQAEDTTTSSSNADSDQPRSELATLTEPLDGVDCYCFPQHETSTGVLSPIQRVPDDQALMLVDATSVAGGVEVDFRQVDVYYYSLQKCFAAEGGLWVAIMSPAARDRANQICADPGRYHGTGAGQRWIPEFLDLSKAISNSAKQQTLNTPAISTLELWAAQLEWMLELGGMTAVEQRTRQTSQVLYDWAEAPTRPWVRPYVSRVEERSPVVVTLDFAPEVNTTQLLQILRDNGIVDLDPYRSLGRNQLRCSCFPTISPQDTAALTECLDYVVERLL